MCPIDHPEFEDVPVDANKVIDCVQAHTQREIFELGRRFGHREAEATFHVLWADPDWSGQVSMGFAATFSQEMTERPERALQHKNGGEDG